MQVTVSEFGDGGKRVVLVGKLDIAGAQEIERPMATVSESRCNIVVDMIGVDFIASIGIRHLVLAAKAVGRAGRQLVLLDPNPRVTGVLTTAGVVGLLPIVRTEEEAWAAFSAPPGSH